MKFTLLMLVAAFLLFGCSDQEEQAIDNAPPLAEKPAAEPADKENSGKSADQPASEANFEAINFQRYFKPDQTTAYFAGEGNEFASFTEQTTWLSDQYVAVVVNNGGAIVMKIYRIKDDGAELIADELVDGLPEDIKFPLPESLEKLPRLEPYLAGPFEIGATFGNWTIVETDATLETPYKRFEKVLVIEDSGEDFVNRKYFAENYGLIKTESMMSVELTEEVTVTSTLQNIEP